MRIPKIIGGCARAWVAFTRERYLKLFSYSPSDATLPHLVATADKGHPWAFRWRDARAGVTRSARPRELAAIGRIPPGCLAGPRLGLQ